MAEENYTAGHRQRIRNRYKSVGFDGSTDVEVLEFLLCYAIPRKDVKPIARQLLKQFGSLKNVFTANIHDLAAVNGMGEISAMFLTSVWDSTRFARVGSKDKIVFQNSEDVGKYTFELLYGRKTEAFYILLLDSQQRLMHVELISEGTIDETPVYISNIVAIVSRHRASMVVLAHNHPGGSLKPSSADYQLTEKISQALSAINVRCVDHIVTTDEGFYAMIVDEEYLYSDKKEKPDFQPHYEKPSTVKQMPMSQGDLARLAEIIYYLTPDDWNSLNNFVDQMRMDMANDAEE